MRKKLLMVWLVLLVTWVVSISGCAAPSANPSLPAPSNGTTPSGTLPADKSSRLVIYAPASTSSIPIILAASKLKDVDLTLYTNQSQANTLFLRGEVSILVTGLSVGVDMYKNGVPLQAVNSYVSGLSYLVTYGKQVSSFADLKGQSIVLPFEGSPIEQTAAYLAKQEGLAWKTDITPVYSPFESSVALLKQGKATAVILPEPNVTLVEGQPNVFISLSLYDAWNKQTGSDKGYPQVASFANTTWAASHAQTLKEFNLALADAISATQKDPAGTIQAVKDSYKIPADSLLKSLNRTHYLLTSGSAMQADINNYYRVIGQPLNEKFTDFYYIPAQ